MVHLRLQPEEKAVISRRRQWFPYETQKFHADDVSELGSTSDGRNERETSTDGVVKYRQFPQAIALFKAAVVCFCLSFPPINDPNPK